MRDTTAAPANPRARITGAVYLLSFLVAFGSLVTPGTPSEIVAHEALLRFGFASNLAFVATYVAVTALLYHLLKPVSGRIALIAAFLGILGCAIQAVASVFLVVPVVLQGSQYAKAFDLQQMNALGQMFLELNTQANYVAVVFFGVFDILIGYLILRSAFMPRILGALMVVAGGLWLIFLSPSLANQYLLYIEVPGFVAELALLLWLLVFGVNVQRWNEQAVAAKDVIRS